MRNSQALDSREYVIHQNAMRRFYGEAGTGSVIVEAHSAPFQAALCDWDLLITAARPSRANHSGTTSAYLVFIKNCATALEGPSAPEFNLEAALPVVALSPASVLDRVRTVFGLNISETADVFGITRQTAYQWMKLADMELVRAHGKRERIKELYAAAQAWQSHPQLKGRWLHALLPDGNTLLDLLKTSPIDLNTMQAAYQVLAASTAERRRDEGERATRAATALADALTGLGAGRKPREG